MKNIDKIRQMSLKELVVLLVSEIEKDVGDYNIEEEYIPCYAKMWHSAS